ncbi:MAG: outer membrane lipoprotein-sorting protein [Pseudomonadota bacterium]
MSLLVAPSLLAAAAPAVVSAAAAPGSAAGILPEAVLALLPADERLASLDPSEAGTRIMRAVEQAQDGFGDLTVDLTMVLRSRSGRETERALTIAQLEVEGDGDLTLVTFERPKAIRGTGLLSHAHPSRDDDQWLYLPALRRVKKIGARNRSGPFLGSEFAFEDLTSTPVEKFEDRYLRREACAKDECYVINRRPLDAFSGYQRQTLWVDTQGLRVLRIEYFDRQERLKKTLVADDFEQHQDRFWRPRRMEMTNARTGKSTLLYWQYFRYSTGLSASRDFSVNALQRVR